MPTFFIRQLVTLMVNQYEVLAANPDGTEGQTPAFAEQSPMALKAKVTFVGDEHASHRCSRSRPAT
ncbi:hypothetical protein [Mycobacterium hubeiense]|uniref:hypothetical protein n=1 Tax=Mycobacterium hubeiense TaxID=1867256 RepID=UPI0018ED1EDD|nr:hypothetical protein [Mycobacterium sp. QGD 101]